VKEKDMAEDKDTSGPQGAVGMSGCPTGPDQNYICDPQEFGEHFVLNNAATLAHNFVLCSGGEPALTITMWPEMDVKIAYGLGYTGAAKMFLNEIARIMGKEPPFSWK